MSLPQLREDIRLLNGPRLFDGSPSWTIQDLSRNLFFRITQAELKMIQLWPKHSAEEIIDIINKKSTINITEQHIENMLSFLQQNQLLKISGNDAIKGLLAIKKAQSQTWWMWLIKNYLMIRIPLFKPDRFLDQTIKYVRFIFTPTFAWVLALTILLGFYLVSRQWSAFQNTFLHFYSLEGIILFSFAVSFAKIAHELGHAYAAKFYGLKVPTLGISFIVMWPVLYTDTRDAWKLTKRKPRLIIGAAGMLTELALAAFCTLLWTFLPDGPIRSATFLLATTTWIVTLIVNLNPLMRFDGYFLFSDFLSMANLQDRSFSLGRWRLRKLLFNLDIAAPEIFQPKLHKILIIYAWSTWIYRFFLFIGIAFLVYYLFFKLLGIILLIVELIIFIGLPIYKELRVWYQMKNELKWNRHSISTLIGFSSLIVLFVYPWQQAIQAPSIIKHKQYFNIYAPVASKISTLNLKQNSQVKIGDTLLAFDSPHLAHKKAMLSEQLNQLKLEARSAEFNNSNRDDSLISKGKITELESEITGVDKKIKKLQIKSPTTGIVVYRNPEIKVGTWVHNKTLLAKVVKKDAPLIEALLSGSDIDRVSMNSTARFYPENIDLPAIDLEIKEIELSNIKNLSSPYLASTYGGDIAVLDQDLTLENTAFLVTLKPITETQRLQNIQRGTVIFSGSKESWASVIWKQILSVILRESGF